MFKEFEEVRVKREPDEDRHFGGSTSVARRPEPGDVGTIVHDFGTDSDGTRWYVVERVNGDGLTEWLMDFREDELEAA